jgi:predicted neuraminidase
MLPHIELPYGSHDQLHHQVGYQWADRNHRYVDGVMLSDNGGETFRLRGYIRGGLHGHLIEPQVVELSDGKVVMLIRSHQDGRLWRSVSPDGGETWSVAERSEIPNPGAKVNLLRASDGRIFMVHNPVGDINRGMADRKPLSLWVSHDDMKTWPVRVDLVHDSNPNASLNYPSGFLDEARGLLRFVWEDAYSVYLAQVPMDIRQIDIY